MARARLLALGGVSAIGFVRVFTRVDAAVDAEEVLDALRDLSILAVDGLVGGQRVAREGALLRHGGVGRRVRGAEELRHSRRARCVVLLQSWKAASQNRGRGRCREVGAVVCVVSGSVGHGQSG